MNFVEIMLLAQKMWGDYTQYVPWACPFFMTQLPSRVEKAVFPLRLGFVVAFRALCAHIWVSRGAIESGLTGLS